jgi:hypothetical protein
MSKLTLEYSAVIQSSGNASFFGNPESVDSAGPETTTFEMLGAEDEASWLPTHPERIVADVT